ncbi:MAG TPA: TetR/AcrR family transcriptional regulator [Asticcacaulis sp.]|nr:TetR/AcrR family transcriptional regulator [Asticcacaulis sp.]
MYNPSDKSLASNREDKPLPVGNRAQSKERNRRKILDSAMTLFRERGFEAATLRDIARGAGLSTGALFANFSDKNQIFITVVEDENARVIRVMREAYDESLGLVERLHKQLMNGYDAAQSNARLILSAFVMKWSAGQTSINEVARLSDLVRYVLLDTLKAAQAAKELPDNAKVECAAEILEDLCFANLRRAFQSSDARAGFNTEQLSSSLSTQIALVVAGLKAA